MNELSILDSLFNDMLCNDSGLNYSANAPRVDVKEEESAYTLEMELPGRSENDVNIELDHDNLTIASKKEEAKEDKKDKKTKYILKERRNASFERRFKLPDDVDKESIKANFKNGILTINMGKKPDMAPKHISIEAC